MELEIKKSKDFDNVLIDKGYYVATFIDIHEVPEGIFGKRYAMEFDIIDAKTRELHRLSLVGYGGKDILSENSKLGKAFKAMNIDIGKKFETLRIPLANRKVEVLVKNITDKNGNPKSVIAEVNKLNGD